MVSDLQVVRITTFQHMFLFKYELHSELIKCGLNSNNIACQGFPTLKI